MSAHEDKQVNEETNGEDTHAEGQQSVAETSNANIQQRVQIQGIKGERAQEKSSVTRLITKVNKLIQVGVEL